MEIADLHIHSKYSRATSKDMNIENLSKYAKIKGITLLGTGDFTHPLWIKEIKEKLSPIGNGFYECNGSRFVLSSEISLMYSQGGKGRKVHLVMLAPSIETAEQITDYLKTKGRVDYDGRPIFNITCPQITEKLMEIDKRIIIIMAHCWTPWFGVLGSMSGFNSIEEAFSEQAKHIFALETGLSCYDSKTEILTDEGWKIFSKVKYTDKICTLNIKNNEIEFQKPKRIFSYRYKGKMYRLKTKRIDLFVTPNHKLLVSHCDFRKNPVFVLKKAKDVFGISKRFKKDGRWTGKKIKHFVLPAVKIKHGSRHYSGYRNKEEKKFPIKPWLKFFGLWTAEGWTTQGKNGDYNVCLCNNDKKLLNEMKKILENFGYNIFQNKTKNIIRVRDYQLFSYLRQFGKCSDKFIPKEIKSLSKELLEILFEYYIKGDGHKYGRNKKGLSATTTSVNLRDDLQEIALKLEISAYYKLEKKKGTPISKQYKNRIYKQREDSWVIYFIRKNVHTVMPSIIKKYNYTESWFNFDDYVFCVSVPNEIVYVRRNGIPVWCGNSSPDMNWRLSALDKYALVSNSDCHSAPKIGREANVFSKLDSYNCLYNNLKNKENFSFTLEFYPEEGKYHFDGHRNCGICLNPSESIKIKNICPKCKKGLTIGVMHRVCELADREEGFVPKNAVPFKKAIPLAEVISGVYSKGVNTKFVAERYNNFISRFGTEFEILLNSKVEEINEVDSKIGEVIEKIREGKMKFLPGYDGVYGCPVFDEKKEIIRKVDKIEEKKEKDKSLKQFF